MPDAMQRLVSAAACINKTCVAFFTGQGLNITPCIAGFVWIYRASGASHKNRNNAVFAPFVAHRGVVPAKGEAT